MSTLDALTEAKYSKTVNTLMINHDSFTKALQHYLNTGRIVNHVNQHFILIMS